MSEAVYRARDLRKVFRSGSSEIRILDGLDLELRTGEIVAVVGASGVGKSTLLHILGLLDKPDSGLLELEGKDLSRIGGAARDSLRNRFLGFVFQFFHLVPELSATDNVLLPARIRAGLLDWLSNGKDTRARAMELLDRVGLSERHTHRPAQLSGGERQRVAIARALMNDPRVLLCDEPTGNLDPATSRDVWEVLRGFRDDGRAILVVTHDDQLAGDADRVLRLTRGTLVEEAASPAA
ncbi:MAG: ABC transporter ATP-binding protein [Planctomycetota bacterium]|jgi:lipoprotein-releasing system ATP-binding protein